MAVASQVFMGITRCDGWLLLVLLRNFHILLQGCRTSVTAAGFPSADTDGKTDRRFLSSSFHITAYLVVPMNTRCAPWKPLLLISLPTSVRYRCVSSLHYSFLDILRHPGMLRNQTVSDGSQRTRRKRSLCCMTFPRLHTAHSPSSLYNSITLEKASTRTHLFVRSMNRRQRLIVL